MKKIISRFYLITIDNKPVYVGYTNRTIKQRFREHTKEKDLPEGTEIKQIDKLSFDFTWDMDKVCENANLVSKRENELILKYKTQDSVYQKGLYNKLGGQTWANVKGFVHSNKDNPKYKRMSNQELLTCLDSYRKRMGKLSNFLIRYHDPRLTKLSAFINNYKDQRLDKLSSFIHHYQDPRLTKLSGFICNYQDPRLTKLSHFISSYKDQRFTKLRDFINHYQDIRLTKLSSFINHYKDHRLDKLGDFINNYKNPKLTKLSSFISNYKDHRLDKLRDFISKYKN